MRRDNVASTLIRCYFDVVCLLGCLQEMSKSVFCEDKKNVMNISSAEFAQRAVNIFLWKDYDQ